MKNLLELMLAMCVALILIISLPLLMIHDIKVIIE
jgi:hypothetical protein